MQCKHTGLLEWLVTGMRLHVTSVGSGGIIRLHWVWIMPRLKPITSRSTSWMRSDNYSARSSSLVIIGPRNLLPWDLGSKYTKVDCSCSFTTDHPGQLRAGFHRSWGSGSEEGGRGDEAAALNCFLSGVVDWSYRCETGDPSWHHPWRRVRQHWSKAGCAAWNRQRQRPSRQ